MISYCEITFIFPDEGFLDFAQLARCYSDQKELYNLAVRGLAKKKKASSSLFAKTHLSILYNAELLSQRNVPIVRVGYNTLPRTSKTKGRHLTLN